MSLRQEYADMLRREFTKENPQHFLIGTLEAASDSFSEATFGASAVARIRAIIELYRDCQK